MEIIDNCGQEFIGIKFSAIQPGTHIAPHILDHQINDCECTYHLCIQVVQELELVQNGGVGKKKR